MVLCTLAISAQVDTSNLTRQQQSELFMQKGKNIKTGAITLLVVGGVCGTVALVEFLNAASYGLILTNSSEERKKADAASMTAVGFAVASTGFYLWSFLEFKHAKNYKKKAEAMLKSQAVYLPKGVGYSHQMIAAGIRIKF